MIKFDVIKPIAKGMLIGNVVAFPLVFWLVIPIKLMFFVVTLAYIVTILCTYQLGKWEK